MKGKTTRMRFILLVLAALLAGCSAVSNPKTATPAAPATASPAVETPAPAATPASTPGGIKVNPPKLPVRAVPGTPASGWATYTSPALGVALDYPQDWVVTENGAGVSFTPPQGSPIVLEGAQSSPAGQDCPTVINAYGQAGTVCLDAATSRYTAEFKLPPGAPTAWVILTVISQEKPAVFLQMFNTLRPLP